MVNFLSQGLELLEQGSGDGTQVSSLSLSPWHSQSGFNPQYPIWPLSCSRSNH